MINYDENETKNEKMDQIDTTYIELGQDSNILNIKCDSVWWWLCEISNMWSWIHETVKQHWGRVFKKALLIKKAMTECLQCFYDKVLTLNTNVLTFF